MLREMGAFGAAMTVILLVLIAIKSILHYLNPKGENNDQTKRYRKHRRFVFGFLSIATLILGAYIITSIKNPELFQEINESTTPGFIYGSRLLVKLLATVAGMSIIAIVLIMLLGMVFCGARTIWYAAFNNKAKFDEIRQGSQSLLQEAIREPMVKIVLTMSVFAAFIVIPLFFGSEGKGMVECWKTGVCYIGDLILKGESVSSNPATPLSVSVAVYIVLYVVICGTFFGAANIVYIIFDDFLTKASGRGFLREYSNSIGLLAIGIAMLSSVFLGKTSSNPDVDSLKSLATKTFANLRNAESLSTDSEGESSLSYSNLLTQMNTLVLNLNDYANVKSIETVLYDLTNELRNTRTASINDEKWKPVWQMRIENLKAQISTLPTFVTSSEDVSEITESQQRILSEFDRTKSCANLDNATRRYINDHNALEQGTIYLTSPYRGLALFALVLAFFLDLSGFVFGVVDLGAKESKNDSRIGGNSNQETMDVPKIFKSMKEKVGENESQWSIRPTANSYKVVTGNFRCEDGVYYYGVFENGIHKEWEVVDDHAYHKGIYLVDNVAARKGVALSEKHQDVIFSNQGFEKMPQDGVYLNGTLSYHEGSLLFEAEVGGKSDKSAENDASPYYIANVEEYVPVHCYAPRRDENITQPAIDLAKFPMKVKVAVLALNPECTRIVAIYLILRE